MTTAMSDIDRTSMRCTVCRQLCWGRKPKILPCSHMFCVKCLESLVRTPNAENIDGVTESTEEFSKLVITCPTCMKVFPVPIGGVKYFLASRKYVSNSCLDDEIELEIDKPVPLCDFCEGNHTAKDNCKECKSKFCSQCRETHDMICPEREVIPLCSKPLETLQTINNGHLGVESVQEHIEVLEAVLSRLDEEEVEVEHQKQAIESDIKARYDAGISTLTEAHDVCWNSLTAAVQRTRDRLQEERSVALNAREKLTNLASDASTSSEDDSKRNTYNTLLNGAELSHFKQRASKIRQPLFFAYTSGRASVPYMMNFFQDYMGHVSSLGGPDRFLETEVRDHEATCSQDELFPPRREDSELKICLSKLTAKVELLIDMVRPNLQTAGFQAIPPVQMRPTLQTAGFQAIPPVQMRPQGPLNYSTYFPTHPTAARTALYASPVTNQSVAAHAVPMPYVQTKRYKFTTSVIPPVVKQQVPPPRSGVIPEKERLTATMLAACPPQEQKQMLGERLFPIIQRMYPEFAGKLTGMLLELDNSELFQMLDSQESLKTEVEKSLAVLQSHLAKEAAAAAAKK